MRIFVQIDSNKLVFNTISCAGLPGSGSICPADFIEVTGRSDGPWAGKVYNPATDTFSVPPANKDSIESSQVPAKYEIWQRWKLTRLEAQARSLQAAVVTALTARENAAWSDYAQALLDWYNASS